MASMEISQRFKTNQLTPDTRTLLKKQPRVGEKVIQSFLFLCGTISILTTLGIVFELGKESLLFFSSPEVNLFSFFTTTTWQPSIGKLEFYRW